MFALKKSKAKIRLNGIMLGLSTSILFFFLGLIVLGFIINFTNINSDSSKTLLTIINYSALFIGGLIAAYTSKNKGWLNGGLVGLSYIICLIIVGNLTSSIIFSTTFLLRVLTFFLTSILGGVIGINMI